jgi:hypothetical protein
MQLLIVHHDGELGEQLVQMVKDYTPHECDFARSEAEATKWARSHAKCALLITQLESPAVDGFSLGGTLAEIFPGLQTLFLPPYPSAARRLEVDETKMFPEPIDGEGLLASIARAEDTSPGTPDLFHTVDLLQMCCLSRRNGAIQTVKQSKSGIVFLRGGEIVHAETTANRGQAALFDIVDWEFVEFAYDRTVRPPVETIDKKWDEALLDAIERNKELKARRYS